MSAPTHRPRPWYCPDALVDDHKAALKRGGDLRMLKTLKVIRSIVVNAGIIAITVYSVAAGGDPTYVGLTGLLTLGLYNGLEVADYFAIAQAVVELRDEQDD